LIVGSKEYPATDSTFGYSAGEAYRLNAEPLRAFIPYSAFGDPTLIATAPSRKLEFKVYPVPCKGNYGKPN
jgi:hypothetical protein